jgi:hypothetical protein
MKKILALVCLGLAVPMSHAQSTNEVDQLKRQLQEIQENFNRVQQEQRQQIDALTRKLEEVQKQQASAASQTNVTAAPLSSSQPWATSAAAMPQAEVARPWSPADPIRFGSAQNYISISFDALVAAGASTANDIESLELGGHDPKQRGFTVQNLETVFDGKIDPYFRGQANVVLQIDPQGETIVEAEEAYLETMSLPANLQVKAGQFFTEFGRLNPSHPHTWEFVDQPLVNGRFMGEDGLRSAGARLSWLAPTPFYSELFFTVANSQGETAHSFRNDNGGNPFFGRPVEQRTVKSPSDMLFVPRYVASFDLTDSQTLMPGVSAAFGPNSTGGSTQIYGVDLFWKWKSPNQHAGFPFVTWQTEGMVRRFEANAFAGDISTPALPRETLTDYGLYSQIAYGFRKGWVAAFRGDCLFPDQRGLYENIVGTDPERASRWRISPNLTWYPSEFSKIRLQYNFDHRDAGGDDHSVWMQFEFLLGAHAAHKF